MLQDIPVVDVAGRRRLRPVHIWAGLGAVFVAVQAAVYIRWVTSSDFRATPTGPDRISSTGLAMVRGFEVVSTVMAVIGLIWFIRGIYKTRRIDTPRLLMLGWLSSYWLDPWLNFLTPMFTYNSYAVNRGSWAGFIPGFHSANGNRIAEPLLINPANYFVTFTLVTFVALWAIRTVKRRRPGAPLWLVVLAGFASVWCTMSLMDVAGALIQHIDAWPGAIQGFSLHGGHYDQFPIIEFICFPTPFVIAGYLLYRRDANGLTPVERGSEQITGPRWKATAARILAVVALCNVLNLGYTTGIGTLTHYTTDHWPTDMPSYLTNGQCGGITDITCPTP